LLLRADVLVHPQTSGRMRGLTLQAMAHGLPVVARQDPMVDHLIDGETARVLELPDAEDWQRHLADLVNDPAQRRSLGLAARQWVNQQRLASTSVAQALHAYRTLTGATLAFEPT